MPVRIEFRTPASTRLRAMTLPSIQRCTHRVTMYPRMKNRMPARIPMSEMVMVPILISVTAR
ncbi:hypothetical protein D3C86_2229550 [compost metagenome]